MKKRLLAATLTAALLCPTTAFGAFTDVSEGYIDAVTYLAERGVIAGYEDDTFRPEQTITRVQAARMFTRQLPPSTVSDSLAFTDVLPEHSDYDAIMQIASLGVLNGQRDGELKAFKPAHALTRAQLAKAFVEAYDLQLHPKQKVKSFDDVPADAWFKPYVDILVSHGLMTGYNKKQFSPNEPVKRKHFAAIYYRYLTSDLALQAEPYVFGKALHADTYAPLAQATVSIYDGEELYMQLTTDEVGTYRAELPAGRYTMTVEKSGFDVQTYTIDASATERVKQMLFLRVEQPAETVDDTKYTVGSWRLTFTLPEAVSNYTMTFPTMTELHIEKDGNVLVRIHVYRHGEVPSLDGNWEVLRENYKGYDYYIAASDGNSISASEEDENGVAEMITSTVDYAAVYEAIFKSAKFQ